MKKLILLSIAFGLYSCDEKPQKSIDHVVYDAFKALKNKDKEKFVSYFDLASVNKLSISEFDFYFNQYTFAVDKYELPEYNIWRKNKSFYLDDSINKIIRVGLPFVSGATRGLPEYTIKINYGEDLLLRGFLLNKSPTAEEMSDREFPHKIDKFEFTCTNLISIRLYYLPGQNPPHEHAKSLEFTDKTLTENIIEDFKPIFTRLNKSKIEEATKISITEELNTNDLKAILFTFKDGNESFTLNIINSANQAKYLEVNHFYIINAAYKYQLSEVDKTELTSILNSYIKKYIK